MESVDRPKPVRRLVFQNATLALLPESTKSDDASRYFRDLAADLIVGAMLVAIARRSHPSSTCSGF